MLSTLDDDALLQVLSVLPAEDLASFVKVSQATIVIGRQDVLWDRHLKEICAKYVTEGTEEFLEDRYSGFQDFPEYDGPPLRMPYLKPWMAADCEERTDAYEKHDGKMRLSAFLYQQGAIETLKPVPNIPREFAVWRVADGVSQYRCYPSSEAKTCPLRRTDVWVPHPFPEVHCCGAKLVSLESFNEHSKSWRHFEMHGRVDGCDDDDKLGRVAPIDPRFFEPDAFNALPKHEAFTQMKSYIQSYESGLEKFLDTANWTSADREKMELLAAVVRDNVEEELEIFADEEGHEYDNDLGLGGDPMDITAEDVSDIIIERAFQGFQEAGPLANAPGIPYYSPREILAYGLADCDPFGGSSSTMQFLCTMSEFLEHRFGYN